MYNFILKSLSTCVAALLLGLPLAAQTNSTPGYDVFLLAGQSNMLGYGTGVDSSTDAAVNPRISAWDNVTNQIIPAVDPLYAYQGELGTVGPALSFAKAYLPGISSNRKVLLVNAALGGSGFWNGFWQAPSGSGPTTAVQYANAAMAAAGPGARFAGILWHQGEADIIYTGAAAYETNLTTLIAYFRSHITGATNSTPFVVGEMTPAWMASNLTNTSYAPQQYTILGDFHTLPETVPYTAWTSSALLPGDVINAIIHFCNLSQRAFGRRYYERFVQAANGLPQPELSLKSFAGAFYDDGRGLLTLSTLPTNNPPTISGTVASIVDPLRGEVAQISQGQGYLSYLLPANTFNGSYTKMAWFKPGATGYYNNLISASNPGQTHFLLAQNLGAGSVSISAGHSSNSLSANVSATVSAASGTWTQIALVYDATAKTMALFVNGTQVASQSNVAVAPSSTSTSATLPVLMGSFTATGGGLDGAMAGNRVWTSALTAAQISSIYNFEVVNTPTGLVFGAVAPSAPATQSYSYTPASGAAVTGLSVLTEGISGGDFSLAKSGTCTLAIATSCTTNVTFTPQFAGLRRGALLITDSTGAQTTVFLSGVGSITPTYNSPFQSVLASGLSTPLGVAVDGGGNVYSANSGAGTVTEVNASGTLVRTISGLNTPSGIAVDGAGTIYIAANGTANVVKVSPGSSTLIPVAFGFNSSKSPFGIATDGAGNVYVANPGSNAIQAISPSGQVHTVVTGSLTLSAPAGVAVDAAGNLFIADSGNARIVEVPYIGAANTSVYATGIAYPSSVAFDGAGNLFVTDPTAGTLYEIAAGSKTPVLLATGFNADWSVAVAANGAIYVADSGNNRIIQLQRAVLSLQTVTFAPIANQAAGTSLALTASASSGLAVSFTSSTNGVCTVSGATVSLANAGTCTITAAQSGNGSYAAAVPVSQSFTVTGTGQASPLNVSLASAFNVYAIAGNGTSPLNGGIDTSGYAYSSSLLATSVTWSGVTFPLGAANSANGVASATISLPAGNYSSLKLLATGVYNNNQAQTFLVTYIDGTTSTYSQKVSDWGASQSNPGESIASTMPYRVIPGGTTQNGPWYLYGYSFALNGSKTVKSLTLPGVRTVVTLAVALTPMTTSVTGGTTSLSLASADNVYAIANNGAANSGTGNDGYSYSANLLGTSLNWAGQTFQLSSASAPSAVSGKTIPLTAGNFNSLSFLGTAVYGSQANQLFTVTYTDGSTTNFTQSISDWGAPQNYAGESIASTTAYRVTPTGATQNGAWNIYGYTFALNSARTVKSLSLPNNGFVLVLAINLGNTSGSLAAQNITFGTIASYPVGTNLTLAATASSGLAVSYSSSTASVCTVSGSALSLLSAGTCTITASQAGNATYAPAVSVTQSFTVGPLSAQPLSLSSVFNVYAIANAGTKPANGGLDNAGYAYAGNLLGSSITWSGATFTLGQAGVADAVTSSKIPLPAGQFSTVRILATAAFGNQLNQPFILTYSDGTTSTYTQSVSDWGSPQSYAGESVALGLSYRVAPDGTTQALVTWNLYGYSIPVTSGKTPVSLTLPNNRSIVVLAVTAS